MVQQHDNPQSAKETFLQALADAYDSGQWCAVVFSSDGRRVIMHRTTYHFNFADIPKALDLMHAWADEELAKETVPRPLPLAPHIVGANGAKMPFNRVPTAKELGDGARDSLSEEGGAT